MESINWDKIYLQLYAYADQLLKVHTWFRGKKTDSYLEGRQPHDYVIDAIEKHLKEPEKYDPQKRSLENYLKLHIIRTAIGNDSKKTENKLSSDLFANGKNDEDADNDFLDAILPYTKGIFDQQIDFQMIMDDIGNSIQSDPIALKIFEGSCRENMKRVKVMENYNLSNTEFDNGMKRLKSTLRQTAKKYNISEPQNVKKKKLIE